MTKKLSVHSPVNKHYALRAFLLGLLCAAVVFVPYIIYQGGIFYYYGDFNVQEIPFYQLVHDAIRSGNTGWHYLTDLGSDLISSYSFYLLGSPFFWLTIPFPSEVVPYLIGPLLILKFACASLAAYLYLQRYVSNKTYAVLGGLLYAFSGFSIYNVFFFHFHEPMIVFPLLLAALDAFLYDKKRGVFALAVFSACVVNYYFFTGQVVFVFMYFFMLVFTKTYKFNIKEFLVLALEVLIGFAATAFILLPSVLGIMGNPRLDTLPESWDALVYSSPQKYWLIILAFFFPADMPAFPVFTTDANCNWGSVAGWLPLFGMTAVIGYLQLRERTWLKKLMLLLILCAFIPVFNSAFQMFNSSIYYARWFYMIVLMFTLATVKALENEEVDWNRAIRWSAGITLGMAFLIGLMPIFNRNEYDEIESVVLGIEGTVNQFWIYVLISLVCILGFALIIKKFRVNTKRLAVILTCTVMVVSIASSLIIIGTGVNSNSTVECIDNYLLNKRDKLNINDLDYVRSDLYHCTDNTQMFWQIQSINCFQSSVSPSIMEFYNSFNITRDVASRPDTTRYGLRGLLSVKYLFDYIHDGESGTENSFIDEEGETRMPYWRYLKTENGFDIYENECYIPMGFTYDSFITKEEFELIDFGFRTEAILYSMVLSKEQMQKYSSITGYVEEYYAKLYSDNPEEFNSITNNYQYGREPYSEACTQRAASSCEKFYYTNSGFKAEFNNERGKENLLFFSVPYSEGFTAYVNGRQVEIENVNNGLMAIKIPAGTYCDIEFDYETPGLKAGLIISVISLVAFIAYFATVVVYKKSKNKN